MKTVVSGWLLLTRVDVMNPSERVTFKLSSDCPSRERGEKRRRRRNVASHLDFRVLTAQEMQLSAYFGNCGN